MWHASVAVLGAHAPTATAFLRASEIRRARLLAASLLEGVGAGETFVHVKEIAIHVRRSLSPTEIAQLDPSWLAIPAVDMG